MLAIFLKNFSEDLRIFAISLLSLLAIGLYNTDLRTGPKPAWSKAIYPKNCTILVVKPLILEP